MRRRLLWWVLAMSVMCPLVLYDMVAAARLKRTDALVVDAVTTATPLTHSTVGVVRSDNASLSVPVPPAEELDYRQVREMVWQAIELAPCRTGPLPSIVPVGSWVVVKPNMVFIKPQPDYSLGDIADPRVSQAVLEYLAANTQARRITLAMGDSWRSVDGPAKANDGGPVYQNGVQVDGWTATWGEDYPGFTGSLQEVLDDLAARYPEKVFDKANFNYDLYPNAQEPQKVPVPIANGIGGWSADSYYVSNTMLNCDVFISVAAMKVHNIPGVSLTHKNYIGTASRLMYATSGWWNAKLHSQPGGPDAVMVDLFSYHPAEYSIVGGAWGMEGRGPHVTQGGRPIRTNMVIAGQDPVAVDAVAATAMGFNPWDIEHLRRSAAKGYGTLDMKHIAVRGDSLAKVQMHFAKPPRQDSGLSYYYGRANRVWLLNGVYPGTDLDLDHLGGEASMRPVEGETTGGQVWTQVISPENMVDLKNTYYGKYGSYQTDVVSYAFTYLYSELAQEGFLWVGADDGVKIWLNGEVVWVNPASGQHRLAHDKVPIALKAGENSLLAKVKNEVGSYAFSVAVVDEDGDTMPGTFCHLEVPTVVADGRGATPIPGALVLLQNYPNPFNSSTVIRFALPADADIALCVCDLAGQRVSTLAQGAYPAGAYTVSWHGRDARGRRAASGLYLYRLQAGNQVETRRLLLLR